MLPRQSRAARIGELPYESPEVPFPYIVASLSGMWQPPVVRAKTCAADAAPPRKDDPFFASGAVCPDRVQPLSRRSAG